QKRQFLFYAAVVGVILIVAGLLGYSVVDAANRRYVMTAGGKRISLEEFKMVNVLFNLSDEKDETVEMVLYVHALEKKAKEHNVKLTSEELENINAYVKSLKEYFTSYGYSLPKLSDKRIRELMSVDVYMERISDIYTADFVFDEDEFAEALENFREMGKLDYITTDVKYLFTNTLEEAEEAHARMLAGEEVDDMIKEYSFYYNEEQGIDILTLADFYDFYIDYDLALEIMELSVGDISDVYLVYDGGDYMEYCIFIIEGISVMTEDELVEHSREQFTNAKKILMFAELLESWMLDLNPVINQKGYDAVW
ncbi:MAG: hypothetical protein FWE82_09410, partial [Defluviitaleaceae bacterium]|nr:hypothetical protein [Defluviitaleaceae bacterium]